MLYSRNDQRLLVFGYIRKHFLCDVPLVLKHLIVRFYNENIYWSFHSGENGTLSTLLEMKNKQMVYGRSFTIKNIVFVCSISSNGLHGAYDEGFVQFLVESKRIPFYITRVVIKFQLCCQETNTFYQEIAILRQSCEGRGWDSHSMRLSQCRDLKSIDFICNVDVLEVQYRQEIAKEMYRKSDINLSTKSNHEWKLKTNTLNKHSWRISDDFDNFGNWCASIKQSALCEKSLIIIVDLLKLPQKVARIQCNLVISIQSADCDNDTMSLVDSQKLKEFSYDENCTETIPFKFEQPPHELMNEIIIKFQINIITLTDIDNKIIPENKYSEFNIKNLYPN